MKIHKNCLTIILIVLMMISLTSCGNNDDLEAKVTTLEERVAALEATVSDFKDYRLSSDYYGKIYKCTEQSLADFKAWAEANPDYDWFWEDITGMTEFKENYDIQISFTNDNTLNLRNAEGLNLRLPYEMIGNDVTISANDLAKLNGDDADPALDGISITIGTLSNDQSYITLGVEFAYYGETVNLYLQ